MKIIIWSITLIGLSPAFFLSILASLMAVFGHHSKIERPGLATHQYITNLFLEFGPLKLAIKPAIVPAILVGIGSALVLYGLRSLRIKE
jgi:hypothetical protein